MDHRKAHWEVAGSLAPELEGAPRSHCHLRSPNPKSQSKQAKSPKQPSRPAAVQRGDASE